jgi:hypothetical protein
VVERKFPVEGKNLEGIQMRAMAGGRIGRQIRRLEKRIAAKGLVKACVARAAKQSLINARQIGLKVPGQEGVTP